MNELVRRGMDIIVEGHGFSAWAVSEADYERIYAEARRIYSDTPEKSLDRAGPAINYVKQELSRVLGLPLPAGRGA